MLVETDREKDVHQQLKQANDTAARLREELRQIADRETRLQREKTKLERKYRGKKIAGLHNCHTVPDKMYRKPVISASN